MYEQRQPIDAIGRSSIISPSVSRQPLTPPPPPSSVEKMVMEDVRNNSAWNQRWFVAHRGKREGLQLPDAQVETNFALENARLDPYNESPWRYLIGIVKERPSLVPDCESGAEAMKDVLEKAGRDRDGCANLNSARIDLLEMKGDAQSLSTAKTLAEGMATAHDEIRAKYWRLRIRELEGKMKEAPSA